MDAVQEWDLTATIAFSLLLLQSPTDRHGTSTTDLLVSCPSVPQLRSDAKVDRHKTVTTEKNWGQLEFVSGNFFYEGHCIFELLLNFAICTIVYHFPIIIFYTLSCCGKNTFGCTDVS